MKQRLKRYTVLGLGWLFVVLGILGIFLPILQGILFLTIGLILLSRESEWAAARLDWLKTRYPRFGKTYDEADRRAMRLWDRLRGSKKQD